MFEWLKKLLGISSSSQESGAAQSKPESEPSQAGVSEQASAEQSSSPNQTESQAGEEEKQPNPSV